MLAGMENVMCALYTDPEAVRELFHRIMNFQLGIVRHYLAIGVEIVTMSDDLGTQRGPLIAPEIIWTFFVPEYRRLFGLYREQGVMINFHSCGYITPMLDMFMDLGVTILNPVQATANDLDEVRRITAGRMALQGGVNSGTIMSGPPDAIRDEVARRAWQLGRDGGYFCGPDQGLAFLPEHVAALHEAVEAYGKYPLQPPEP